jgi:hypothetical protein
MEPQASSNKNYTNLTWMYEYVVTKEHYVNGIATFIGSNSGGGSYRLFIYDSGTNSNNQSYPTNLLYQSSKFTVLGSLKSIGFLAKRLTPGVYWVGIVCSSTTNYFNVVSPVNIKSILGNQDNGGIIGPANIGLIENTSGYSGNWYTNGMPDPMPNSVMKPASGLPTINFGPYPIYLRKYPQ